MKIIFEVETNDKFPDPAGFVEAVKNKIESIIDNHNFWCVKHLKAKVSYEIISDEEKFWILYIESRCSLIRGWFSKLEDAIKYYNDLIPSTKSKVAVFDQYWNQVYPKK